MSYFTYNDDLTSTLHNRTINLTSTRCEVVDKYDGDKDISQVSLAIGRQQTISYLRRQTDTD